jgi:hypothetical protein
MRNFIFIFSLFCFGDLIGQGNLQFNQVINNQGTISAYANSTLLTVPTGKVWKVESILCSSTSLLSIKINNSTLPIPTISNAFMPIWLKENNTIQFYNGGSTGTVRDYFISIIEYNVVP